MAELTLRGRATSSPPSQTSRRMSRTSSRKLKEEQRVLRRPRQETTLPRPRPRPPSPPPHSPPNTSSVIHPHELRNCSSRSSRRPSPLAKPQSRARGSLPPPRKTKTSLPVWLASNIHLPPPVFRCHQSQASHTLRLSLNLPNCPIPSRTERTPVHRASRSLCRHSRKRRSQTLPRLRLLAAKGRAKDGKFW